MLDLVYKQDILDTSVNTNRQYNPITNPNGSQSFTDVTSYLQRGDPMGSSTASELVQNMMGFVASKTTFNSDGSITEENTNGTMVTVFNSDGTITATFTDNKGNSASSTTTFNQDGTISVSVEISAIE